MKKWLAALLLVAAYTAQGVHADTPSIAGTTWDLTGKLSGKAGAKCAQAGGKVAPIDKHSDLHVQLTFDDNEEQSFTWYADNLLDDTAYGTWSQNGNKIELEFYDAAGSAIKGLSQTIAGDFFVAALPNASVSDANTLKYTFTGVIKAKGTKLLVTEQGGFKFNANAALAGQANNCSFTVALIRKYSGGQVTAP